jgi:hypothetical protein
MRASTVLALVALTCAIWGIVSHDLWFSAVAIVAGLGSIATETQENYRDR